MGQKWSIFAPEATGFQEFLHALLTDLYETFLDIKE